jgi:hypothetical protein
MVQGKSYGLRSTMAHTYDMPLAHFRICVESVLCITIMPREIVVSATELWLRICEGMPHCRRWWKCNINELSFVFVCISFEQF